MAPPRDFLKGDVFALERGGEANMRVASAEVKAGERPKLQGHLSYSLRIKDLYFNASRLKGPINREAKKAVLTALLTKYERELTRVELETPE